MKKWQLTLGMLLLTGALLAPGSLAQAPYREAPPANGAHSPNDGHDHYDIDPRLLIKAQAAYELLKTRAPLVVDVRSRVEYNAEHIQGSISYPYSVIRMGSQFPFPKERKLFLYCGCPHHLSGLSAEVLKQKGYQDVHVIDEGYWGWKAMGFPVVVNPNAPKQISMDVEGTVLSAAEPVVYQDIFLLHPETGQLEATRTDAEGRFKMALHFRGLGPDDQLMFQMHDRNLLNIRLADLETAVTLDLPAQAAQH